MMADWSHLDTFDTFDTLLLLTNKTNFSFEVKDLPSWCHFDTAQKLNSILYYYYNVHFKQIFHPPFLDEAFMIQKWNNFHSWYPFQKIWFKSNIPAKNYRNRVLGDSIRAKIPKGRLPHSKRINFYTMAMASLNESEYFDSCCTMYMWWLGFWPEICWLKSDFFTSVVQCADWLVKKWRQSLWWATRNLRTTITLPTNHRQSGHRLQRPPFSRDLTNVTIYWELAGTVQLQGTRKLHSHQLFVQKYTEIYSNVQKYTEIYKKYTLNFRP